MQISDETKKELDVFFKESLTSLTGAVTGTASAIKENAPLIAKEIVLSELIDSGIGLVCSTLFMVLSSYAILHIWSQEKMGDFLCFMFGLSVLVGIVSTVGLFCSITSITKAILTPRLIIFDYVSGFLKPEEKKS